MATELEIGHARHRSSLAQELTLIVDTSVKGSRLNITGMLKQLVPFEGQLRGDTIENQAVRLRWDFEGGHWIDIHITATHDTWDAILFIASSVGDLDFTLPQGNGADSVSTSIDHLINAMA